MPGTQTIPEEPILEEEFEDSEEEQEDQGKPAGKVPFLKKFLGTADTMSEEERREYELRKLSRIELLEILTRLSKENERLKQEILRLEDKLEERKIDIDNTGSIAEAALKLSGVFESAQKAAEIYLDNINNKEGEPIRIPTPKPQMNTVVTDIDEFRKGKGQLRGQRGTPPRETRPPQEAIPVDTPTEKPIPVAVEEPPQPIVGKPASPKQASAVPDPVAVPIPKETVKETPSASSISGLPPQVAAVAEMMGTGNAPAATQAKVEMASGSLVESPLPSVAKKTPEQEIQDMLRRIQQEGTKIPPEPTSPRPQAAPAASATPMKMSSPVSQLTQSRPSVGTAPLDPGREVEAMLASFKQQGRSPKQEIADMMASIKNHGE